MDEDRWSILYFPDGGTMFLDGAEQFIDKLGQHIPFNKGVVRTALDMYTKHFSYLFLISVGI